MDAHLSLSSTVVLTPHRAGLCAGQDNTVEVLVRIQAPEAPAGHGAQRPPQALALVIDRSGSMAGRPLEEAKRCAEYVLGKLRPTDAVALVKFDNRVQRLWPAAPLADGAPQRAAIAGIHAGGNTNLHGGWKEGADALVDVAGQGLKRVILLSDGQANEGVTDPAEIAAQCAAWATKGITTSTYGLGNSFNEELMVAMARAGAGNHYYGDTANDLMEPFQQELELLGNLCLRDLRLAATTPDGFSVEIVNQLPKTDTGWRLPDLAWGAEAWAVLRVSVPAGALPPVGQLCAVLRVAITGQSLEGDAVSLERSGLSLPVMTSSAFGNLAEDELVTRRLVELAAAEALMGMRSAAAAGDWARVEALLEAASRQFAGNEWVAAVLEAMRSIAAGRERERAMKEMMYSSSKLRSRLAAKDESVAFSLAEGASVPAYLRRKPAQGKGDV
ncbi:MAG: vWA domain-containing protein [Betaproteobacteria bacterium]